MKLMNNKIYQYAQELIGIFDKEDLYIPVKANFLIQKNIRLITAAGQEIEQSRLQIARHYGALNEEQQQYIVPPEKIEEANQEIHNLFAIEQDLDIKTIKLEDLGNIALTATQMKALMFMIEE